MVSIRLGIRLCILGLLVWMLAGCQLLTQAPTPTLDASLMDRSLLTDKPCPAPCWYGLELGKSTKSDVLAILHTLSFVNPDTIQEDATGYWDRISNKNLPATLISVSYKASKWQSTGLIVPNNTLVNIGIFPNYNLSFGETVDHLGLPDYVGASLDIAGTTCYLKLMWLNRQIVVEHRESNGQQLCAIVRAGKSLYPNLSVNQIDYELPQWFSGIPFTGSDYPWPSFIRP